MRWYYRSTPINISSRIRLGKLPARALSSAHSFNTPTGYLFAKVKIIRLCVAMDYVRVLDAQEICLHWRAVPLHWEVLLAIQPTTEQDYPLLDKLKFDHCMVKARARQCLRVLSTCDAALSTAAGEILSTRRTERGWYRELLRLVRTHKELTWPERRTAARLFEKCKAALDDEQETWKVEDVPRGAKDRHESLRSWCVDLLKMEIKYEKYLRQARIIEETLRKKLKWDVNEQRCLEDDEIVADDDICAPVA